MSVLIKGLTKEKVESCFRFAKDGWCIFDMPEIIEVPPHGRLIDADAILGKINAIIFAHPDEADLYEQDAVIVKDWLRSEPTVIESEGRNEDAE